MILETKVSFFKSTRQTESERTISVGEALNQIKTGVYAKQVAQVRGGDTEAKKNLPTIAFHGLFDGSRKKEKFYEASGLVILDIDDVELDEIEEAKIDIIDSNDSVLAAMTSPSGNGIKILYYVQPDLITAENYRQIGIQLVKEFELYGNVDFLSVTDCLIMTSDPNIQINSDAFASFVYVKETVFKKFDLEPRDEKKELWENVEDFFDTVLAEDIAAKTNNNFHYIQVAVFDLAKFGFYHPAEDLSFVIDYAENEFKHSSENKTRFLEVAEIAKNYPQQRWPYYTVKDDDFEGEMDEEYFDYSDFVPEPKQPSIKSEEKPDTECEGMVDYVDFFDRVLDVAKQGDRVGAEISFSNFADIFRFKGTGILTTTGIPGHGKTEFVDACLLDLARLHGHDSVICGFEQTPEEHVIKLMRKLVGVNVTAPTWLTERNLPTFKGAYDFVTQHIRHIDTTKIGGNINRILEIAAKQIKESRDAGRDVKYMVFDPFNMLSIKGKYSGHEKIEEILRRLTHFSHQMEVLVILVAHPFKMKKDEKTGKYEVPDFYSVKGSSAFFEMSYHGLVVYRTGYEANDPVQVKVLKVKQNNLGITGETAYFCFNRESGRYVPIDENSNELAGDHYEKNWLEKAVKK